MMRLVAAGPLALFLGAVPDPSPTKASPLEIQWRAELGPSERLVYRSAVCPEGGAYVSDSRGRVVAVSRDGKLTFDRQVVIDSPLFAAACNRGGDLVLATGGPTGLRLTTVSGPDQPVVTVDVRADEDRWMRGVHSMALTESGTAILAVRDAASAGTRLAYVGSDGVVRHTTPPSPGDSSALGAGGTVLWSSTQRQVTFVPGQEAIFDSYDPSGRSVGRKRPSGANLSSGDRIASAAALPGGRFVAQIAGSVPDPRLPEARLPTTRIEILTPSLETASTLEGAPGLLVGADDEGHLYFQQIVVNGGTALVKAKLAAHGDRRP